jgi:hypothetical protein
LEAVGVPIFSSFHQFSLRYFAAWQGSQGWDYSGSSNLSELVDRYQQPTLDSPKQTRMEIKSDQKLLTPKDNNSAKLSPILKKEVKTSATDKKPRTLCLIK